MAYRSAELGRAYLTDLAWTETVQRAWDWLKEQEYDPTSIKDDLFDAIGDRSFCEQPSGSRCRFICISTGSSPDHSVGLRRQDLAEFVG